MKLFILLITVCFSNSLLACNEDSKSYYNLFDEYLHEINSDSKNYKYYTKYFSEEYLRHTNKSIPYEQHIRNIVNTGKIIHKIYSYDVVCKNNTVILSMLADAYYNKHRKKNYSKVHIKKVNIFYIKENHEWKIDKFEIILNKKFDKLVNRKEFINIYE